MILHTTTAPEDFRILFQNPDRKAIWVHVQSAGEWERFADITLAEDGWRVLPSPAPYFFVAARLDVGLTDALRLLELIKPDQSAEDARWLGELFGYCKEDIEWYIEASGLS